jgi:hypothetical protein
VAADSNPFATRFIRPDAAPYLFPAEFSAQSLVEKLRASQWWGEIVGPHGAGKSTLLTALVKELTAAGRHVVRYALSESQRTLPTEAADTKPWNEATQVVVDGYEQLSWWSRWRLKSRCRRSRAGLLVTSHTSVGLPRLLAVEPSLAQAQRVVAALLPPGDATITPADVAQTFARQRANLRETLFALYDLYQARRAQ